MRDARRIAVPGPPAGQSAPVAGHRRPAGNPGSAGAGTTGKQAGGGPRASLWLPALGAGATDDGAIAPPEPRLAIASPLNRQTTADQVAERLVTAIALGGYLPGEKLPPQRELAARLCVSRATLRDAVSRLKDMGLVSVVLGRSGGCVVRSAWTAGSAEHVRNVLVARWQDFESLFDVTREIHPVIARLAAERRSATDLRQIRAAVRAFAGEGDADIQAADHEIHAAIARATHSPHLVSLDLQVREQLSLGTDALPSSRRIRELAAAQHGRIADAIDAGQGGRAARLTREHFLSLVERPLRDMRERVQQDEGDCSPAPVDS